jgi:hypothetical protein
MTKSTPFKNSLATMTIAICAVCSGMWRAEAATYLQTDLVSDIFGFAITDPELQKPWGLTSTATSPFWINSEQLTGDATLYGLTGSADVSGVAAVNPPSGGSIPATGSDAQQWPVEAPAAALALPTSATYGGPALEVGPDFDTPDSAPSPQSETDFDTTSSDSSSDDDFRTPSSVPSPQLEADFRAPGSVASPQLETRWSFVILFFVLMWMLTRRSWS